MMGARTPFGALGNSDAAWGLCAQPLNETTKPEGRTP